MTGRTPHRKVKGPSTMLPRVLVSGRKTPEGDHLVYCKECGQDHTCVFEGDDWMSVVVVCPTTGRQLIAVLADPFGAGD